MLRKVVMKREVRVKLECDLLVLRSAACASLSSRSIRERDISRCLRGIGRQTLKKMRSNPDLSVRDEFMDLLSSRILGMRKPWASSILVRLVRRDITVAFGS